MNRKIYKSPISRMITAIVFVAIIFSGSVISQSWTPYDSSVLPNATVPVFSASSGTYQATENAIIDDLDVPGNKFLRMDVNGNPQSQFYWRMNFASLNVTVTNLTVVMRVKGHADRDLALDLDMHYNDIRSRITVHTATKQFRIRNGSGTNVTLGETYDATAWNTYRFTMTATATNVYLNEDPIPVLTFAPVAAASTNKHFRFGDGDSGASFGADIDWVIWDVSGAYAPGEGAAIPNPVVTPSWDASLSEIKVEDVALDGFNTDVLAYEVVLPAGVTTVPVVSATATDLSANLVITQAAAIPGTANIVVTAENTVTKKTYTVGFRNVAEVATLQQIAVNGVLLEGFDPAVEAYTINLPLETTLEIPVVTALATDTNADVVITQATETSGQATIVVTAEDGVAKKTYTVDFKLVSTIATLSDLLIDGTTIIGFDSGVIQYTLLFPQGTTEMPVVSAVSTNANATMVITQATAIPGEATVVVTAEDGTTKITYTVILLTGSDDSTLSDLKVDDTTIVGFAPAVTDYYLVLPVGTTVVPVISAIANDTKATLVITQATEIPGVATVVVTAEDNFNKTTYSVHIRNLSTNASLSDLMVDGTSVFGFDPAVLSYEVLLPVGTTVVPVVTGTSSDENAAVAVTAATAIPGATTVVVTAEDNTTTLTYTINFGINDGPHNWRMYDASVLPNLHGPAFAPSNTAGAGATNVIIADPDNAGNSFLEFSTATNGDNYMWVTPLQPETPGLTLIIRVKAANDTSRRVIEVDIHHNGIRERFYINREANKLRLHEGIGGGDGGEIAPPEGVSLSDWNTYRITKSEGATKVYLNENPVAIAEGTSATATTNQYFRFGDGNGSHNSAAIIDWIVWDETGAYAPGEGSPIPSPVVSPNWDATLAQLTLNGTLIEGFDAAVTEYNILVADGTVVIPVVAASVNNAGASLTVTQATEIPGTAVVEVIAFNGFTTISYLVNFVIDDTSVELIADKSFRIYPNPASNFITIELPEGTQGAVWQIINTAGQVVMHKNSSSVVERIDISALQQGVYIMQLVSEKAQARKLFIKQ